MFSLCVPRSLNRREAARWKKTNFPLISWIQSEHNVANFLEWTFVGLGEKLIYRVTLVSEITGIFTGESHEGLEGDSNKLYIRTSNKKCLLFHMEPASKHWSRLTTLIVYGYGLCLQCSLDVVSWWPFRFPAKCLIFIIICILPFLVWYSTARWAVSWFCLQHWLWTLFPLWDSPVTKQRRLKENIKLPNLLALNFISLFTCTFSSYYLTGDEISLIHNRQII